MNNPAREAEASGKTRRKYLHVGSMAASLPPTDLPDASASHAVHTAI
ncbi:MAG: hypothetical protein L0Z73_19850 [Gammaproteobacteria bacterium]|nr:hypothetical protein [Gammaproteobacteria bacterium]